MKEFYDRYLSQIKETVKGAKREDRLYTDAALGILGANAVYDLQTGNLTDNEFDKINERLDSAAAKL